MPISQSVIYLDSGEARIQLTVPFTPSPSPDPGTLARQPVRSQISVVIDTSGGSFTGGLNVYYFLCALDSSGLRTRLSMGIEAAIPTGSNTNKITLSGITRLIFDVNSITYEIYRSVGDPYSPQRIFSGTVPSGASVPASFQGNTFQTSAFQQITGSPLWSFTDTDIAGDGTPAPDEIVASHRAYWRKTGDTLWTFGAETKDRTQTSLVFLLPLNVNGQSIDVQVRPVNRAGVEMSQGIAPYLAVSITGQHPPYLVIGSPASAGGYLSVNGTVFVDTVPQLASQKLIKPTTVATLGSLTAGGNPITADNTGKITIASWTLQTAFGQENYNSGSVSGLSLSTTYYVSMSITTWDTPNPLYSASTSRYATTAAESLVSVGQVTTPASGGASTSGSGEGGGGGPISF